MTMRLVDQGVKKTYPIHLIQAVGSGDSIDAGFVVTWTDEEGRAHSETIWTIVSAGRYEGIFLSAKEKVAFIKDGEEGDNRVEGRLVTRHEIRGWFSKTITTFTQFEIDKVYIRSGLFLPKA